MAEMMMMCVCVYLVVEGGGVVAPYGREKARRQTPRARARS